MKNIYIKPTPLPSKLYVRNDVTPPFYSNFQGDAVNIYITSDEKIENGDWCISLCDDESYEEIYQCKDVSLIDKEDKKIILTDNQDLIKDGVQAIDDDFIEWFIKNPCDEIFVNKIEGFDFQLDKYSYNYKIIIPKEDLGYTTKMGVEVSNEMVRKTMIPKEYFGKQGIDIKEFERKANEIIEQVGPNNIIDTWLEKHGNPEITKQVEAEAKELCKQETLEEEKDSVFSQLEVGKEYEKEVFEIGEETLEEALERIFDDNLYGVEHYRAGFLEAIKWQSKRMYSKEEVIEHLNHLIMLPSSELDKFTNEEEMITMKWFEQFKKR